MLQVDSTHYSGKIPPQVANSTVYYYVKAKDSSGEFKFKPAQAPDSTFSYTVLPDSYQLPSIVINEFLANNKRCHTDEYGEFDDWIELFNTGTEAVDVGGMYLSDNFKQPKLWQIPKTAPDSTTIPPGGFLILWCDKSSEQGVLHVELKLNDNGEQIGLFSSLVTNNTPIDTLTFQAQMADTSYGRFPDGSDNWQLFLNPTPGKANQP